MRPFYEMLQEDVRIREGLNACINCGTCTAICPAASFYTYDPRSVADMVQSQNNEKIEALLKSDTIWYCGECMSCKTRCPRGNVPGLIIMALRSLSIDTGLFIHSEKGRQLLALKRSVGDWIINTGYCLYLEGVSTENHPEQGPVWDWKQKNWRRIFDRLGGNYQGDGPGILRKIPEEAMDELRTIFEVTGGMERFRKIEEFSASKAAEMGFQDLDAYNSHVFSHCSPNHYRNED